MFSPPDLIGVFHAIHEVERVVGGARTCRPGGTSRRGNRARWSPLRVPVSGKQRRSTHNHLAGRLQRHVGSSRRPGGCGQAIQASTGSLGTHRRQHDGRCRRKAGLGRTEAVEVARRSGASIRRSGGAGTRSAIALTITGGMIGRRCAFSPSMSASIMPGIATSQPIRSVDSRSQMRGTSRPSCTITLPPSMSVASAWSVAPYGTAATRQETVPPVDAEIAREDGSAPPSRAGSPGRPQARGAAGVEDHQVRLRIDLAFPERPPCPARAMPRIPRPASPRAARRGRCAHCRRVSRRDHQQHRRHQPNAVHEFVVDQARQFRHAMVAPSTAAASSSSMYSRRFSDSTATRRRAPRRRHPAPRRGPARIIDLPVAQGLGTVGERRRIGWAMPAFLSRRR